MAQYICPCCGQHFNGKKCRSCLYENFDDDIQRSLHSHKEANALRPARGQREWNMPKYPVPKKRKQNTKRKGISPWLIWLLVFFLMEPVLDAAGEVIDTASNAMGFVTRTPEPIPSAAIPEGSQEVFSSDGLAIYLGETDSAFTYPLYLRNETDQDVRLSASRIIVDGFLSEQSGAYASASAGTTLDGELWLDAEDMQYATMDIPHQIQVDFYIYDAASYEDILAGSFIIGNGAAETLPPPAGNVLLDSGGIQIRDLGYKADEFDPGSFTEGFQLFYVENFTEDTLSIYSEEVRMDGEAGNIGLWVLLPPGCRTVTRMWLYALEDLDVYSLDDAKPLELDMVAFCEETSERMDLGTITLTFS